MEIPTTPESLAMQHARSIQHSVTQALLINQFNRQKAEQMASIAVDAIAHKVEG